MVERCAASGVGRAAAIVLAVLLFLLGSAPWLHQLPGAVTVAALTYAALGLGDGWQCLSDGTIRYAPGRDTPDRALLADLPATAAAKFAGSGFIAEEVEVRPAEGLAIVHGRRMDAAGLRLQSVVLHAGTARLIDLPWGGEVRCLGLGGWGPGVPG